jgi:sec-independent protein translocase protein TatA
MVGCFFVTTTLMMPLAFLSNLAGPDLFIVLLIVLVLFGAKRLPELARGMGQAVKEFQKAKDEFTDELHGAGTTPTADANRAPAATVPGIENLPAPNQSSAPTQNVTPPERRETA